MFIKIVFYLFAFVLVSFVAYILYNKLPTIFYPIISTIKGEKKHDQLRAANERILELELSLIKKDALIEEIDLSAQVLGYSQIVSLIDRHKSENNTDTF